MPRSADHAYRYIHDAIIRAEFSPGMHLKEQELSAIIGVSRTPVREALRRLANDGLVVFTRYQGTFVQKYAREDLYEIYELRALLMSHAAERAAARITESQIEELEKAVEQLENITRYSGPPITHAELNRLVKDFHTIVVKAADSRRTEGMIEPLLNLPASLLERLPPPKKEDVKRAITQFRDIITAFRAKDAEWAKALTRALVLSARRRTQDVWQHSPLDGQQEEKPLEETPGQAAE